MTNKNPPPREPTDLPTKPEDESRRPRRLILEVNPEEKGMAIAIESGITEPLSEHIAALKMWGEPLGDAEWDGRWDPQNKPSDAMLAQEHDERLKKRPELDKLVRQRDAEYRESEAALADVPAAGTRPLASAKLQAVAILAISISLSPTLRDDFFASIENGLIGWTAALVVGATLASLVVGTALWNVSAEEG